MNSSGIDRAFERRLAALVNAREPRVLQGGLKGVEKESLRVSPDGHIEQSNHPRELGSALTHEPITNDYSEALIELVTPAFRESWELLQYLCDLHQFVYRHLGDQLLWATSMPCRSEEHTSELQSRVDISYAVFCLKKKQKNDTHACHDTRAVRPCSYG